MQYVLVNVRTHIHVHVCAGAHVNTYYMFHSDIGSHEQGETSNGELHVEEQGPQPQPAVITTRINDKVCG